MFSFYGFAYTCIHFFLAVTVLNHQHVAQLAASLVLDFQSDSSCLYGDIPSRQTGELASLKWDPGWLRAGPVSM